MRGTIITLDILALIIQFIGAIIMYQNSPINKLTGAMFGGNYNEDIPRQKNRRLRFGFLLLASGILISLVSLLLKDFFL
jgi:hypothetical protein